MTASLSRYGSHMLINLLKFHSDKCDTGCSNNTVAGFVITSSFLNH